MAKIQKPTSRKKDTQRRALAIKEQKSLNTCHQPPDNVKVGRPTKYSPSMIKHAKNYIKNCPDVVPSLCGLAMELKVCKRTINRWKSLNPSELDPNEYPKFEEFLHMLDALSDFQERTALNSGATGDWNSVIAKLVLAKHGYTDQTNLNLGGQGQSRPIVIKTIGFDNDDDSNE